MTVKSVIIIGAGMAGLSAGVYGQINGYRTRIFEHHAVPGGVVTTWKRKGYTINYAPHFMWHARPGESIYELYRDLGVLPGCRFHNCLLFRFTDEGSGQTIVLPRDLDGLAEELKALSPADALLVEELMAATRALGEANLGDMGMDKPPELTGILGYARQIWGMRRVMKYFAGKFGRPVSDYVRGVKNPFLKRVLEYAFLPDIPVWFLCMIFALYTENRAVLVDGPSLNVARAIEKRYLELGGAITYKATVDEILVENGRAVGVCLADGSVHKADAVISAADGYSTIYDMLGAKFEERQTTERYRDWPLIRPTVSISIGVTREFPGEPHTTYVFLAMPFIFREQKVEGFYYRVFNYGPEFAPPGKTVIQADFESAWEYWKELRETDKEAYASEKERVAAVIVEHLERIYPGLGARVEMVDVATPYTIWRYTRNYHGAYMGWLPTPKALTARVKRTLPGLKNFYMAGQWVIPGGGVPPCLFSGRHAIQLLCHDDNKSFAR